MSDRPGDPSSTAFDLFDRWMTNREQPFQGVATSPDDVVIADTKTSREAARRLLEAAERAEAEAATEPVAVEPEPEPVAVEPEPEPVAVEPQPEPVAVEPQPEPVAVEPEPVAVEPEPVAVEPEPVAVEPEPEPLAVEPVAVEPVAVEPEPEPVAVEPAPQPATVAPEPTLVHHAPPPAPAAPPPTGGKRRAAVATDAPPATAPQAADRGQGKHAAAPLPEATRAMFTLPVMPPPPSEPEPVDLDPDVSDSWDEPETAPDLRPVDEETTEPTASLPTATAEPAPEAARTPTLRLVIGSLMLVALLGVVTTGYLTFFHDGQGVLRPVAMLTAVAVFLTTNTVTTRSLF